MNRTNPVRRKVIIQATATSGRWAATVVVLTLGLRASPGQEALRYSAVRDAGENTKVTPAAELPYTLKSGDLRMLLSSSLGLAWNDNVYTRHRNAKADFILTPLMDVQMSYPLTTHNQLSLNLGAGYQKYFDHDDLSSWLLRSGSQIAFDAYVKDVRINVHDQFQYVRDSSQEPAVANTGKYGTMDNLAGLMAIWSIRDAAFSAGYDHQNVISPDPAFEYENRHSELFLGRALYRVHPRITVGLEASGALTSYDQPVLNDNTSVSVGAYGNYEATTAIRVESRGGYVGYQFDQTSRSISTMDLHTWYGDLTLRHKPTTAVSYSLSGGHEARLGVQADMIEDWYARSVIEWGVMKNLGIQTSLSYENGRQGQGNVSGNLTENYNWFGGDILLSYWIMERLRAECGYRFTIRSSSDTDREYTQNLVHLNLSYQF